MMNDIRFNDVIVDRDRRRLMVDGQVAKVGARSFDVLLALVDRRDRVVSKNELLEVVWPDAVVNEGNLQVHVFSLRKLLGADTIATVPGRGYRFVAVLDGQQSITPACRAEPEFLIKTGAPLSNLRPDTTQLYGREHDAETLKALIAQHRLVSVVGPGGIGKTRLAQAVARERLGVDRDGVWLVELASIERSELVVSTIARVIGHTPGPQDSALDVMIDAMREQKLLMVLDNCEQVAGAVTEIVSALLASAPGVKLLVTSQEPLRVPTERVYRLGSLSFPAQADLASAKQHGAVALFVSRVQAANARFELDEDNVEAIVDICADLDGVPLAIELAAARVSLLGVYGVRQRLNEKLRLLSISSPKLLPRHRALAAALEWSYSLLSDHEQLVIDCLGIFVGGFSLEAAQELLANEQISKWAALDHLSTLIEKSLVIVDIGEPPRYRLLETTRTFALERLAAAGILELTRRKHALALITTLRASGYNKSPLALTGSADIDNLRAAARWAIGPGGDRTIAVDLTAAANYIWYVLGLGEEGAYLFNTVEAWVNDTTPPELAAAFWLSRSKLYSAATQTAAELGLKAAEIYRSLARKEELFDALTNVSLQFAYGGNFGDAERALVEASSLLDPNWPRWTRVVYGFSASSVQYWAGSIKEARVSFQKTLDLARGDGGDAAYAAIIEMLLLGCDVALHKSYDVVRIGREMLERNNPPIRGFTRAVTESFRIAALTQIGELAEAETALIEALPRIRRALGTMRTTLCHIAFLLARQGRCADAAKLLGAVDALRPAGTPILAPPNRASYDDAKAIISKAVGEFELDRLASEGHHLTEESAISLAFPKLTIG
jgi:predicted ATPase/DNA-binding winged helix-turn-helix (wHTH) protein